MILVTGGLGYIGSHTAVELIERGKQVLLVDDLSNSSLQVLEGIQKITGQTVDFLELDIKEAHKVKTLFKDYPQINGVIHFAAAKGRWRKCPIPTKILQKQCRRPAQSVGMLASSRALYF